MTPRPTALSSVSGVYFGLLCVTIAAACGGELESASSARADSAMAVREEFVVDTATVQIPLSLAAQLYVEHDAIVVARTSGTVDSIFVELGDPVVAGQRLAQLERREQEIALANAEAALENQVLVTTRTRALTSTGGATVADSQQAEFQLRQAEITRQSARRELELTLVTAPFAGVVSARAVRPSRFVSPGDTLFRVTEANPLLARVRVPERSAAGLRRGESATVVASNGASAAAKILHIAPIIDAASGTREVILTVASAREPFRTGANVSVRIGQERRQVVFVPRQAIAPEGYALVIENGRNTMRAVVLGAPLEKERVEVVSGLSPGERLANPNR